MSNSKRGGGGGAHCGAKITSEHTGRRFSAGQLLAFVLYGERRDRPAECYVINLIAVSVFLCTCREIEFSISLHARSTSAPHDNNQGLIHRAFIIALYIFIRDTRMSLFLQSNRHHTLTRGRPVIIDYTSPSFVYRCSGTDCTRNHAIFTHTHYIMHFFC
jgi:hypothetical protein